MGVGEAVRGVQINRGVLSSAVSQIGRTSQLTSSLLLCMSIDEYVAAPPPPCKG